jgi:ABC-type iron transport system FetAB permease component
MPEIVTAVIAGADPIDALKYAIVRQMDLCAELAENKSSRAKFVNDFAFRTFLKRIENIA